MPPYNHTLPRKRVAVQSHRVPTATDPRAALAFPFSREGEIVSMVYLQATRRVLILAVLALVAGVVLRLIFLDADPVYDLWAGYLTDEGRWTEQARRVILFGSLNLDGWYSRVHLGLAPLYQAVTALSFAVFGVGFSSARLVSALSGIALLLSAFLFLRRRFSSEALLLTTVVLALQPDLLLLSRVAIPEMASMLFQFLAFSILLSAPRSARRAATGGLLTAVALGFKVTAAPIVPIFAVIVWAVHHVDDPVSRSIRLAAFVAAVLAPAIAVFGLSMVAGVAPAIEVADLSRLFGFIQFASAYSVADFLFDSPYVKGLNVVLLGLWTIAGMLIARGRLPKSGARDIYVGSAIWLVVWLGFSSVLEYFPLYYTFHVFVPVALNLGAGLTLLQSHGPSGIVDYLARAEGRAAKIATIWLLLPLTVLLCRLMGAATDVAGFTLERLSHRLALIAVLHLVLVTVAMRWRPHRLIAGSVCLPLVVVAIWSLAGQARLVDGVFWSANGMSSLVTWVSVLLMAAVIIALLFARYEPGAPTWKWAFGYILALSSVWLLQIVPNVVSRTYTIADTSMALGAEIEDAAGIASGSAASIFLGNRLHYTVGAGHGLLPEFFVVAFDRLPPPLLEDYRLIREYPLEFGAVSELDPGQLTLKIYRRVD